MSYIKSIGIFLIFALLLIIIGFYVYKDNQYKQSLLSQKQSERKLNQEAFDKCISKAEYEFKRKYRDDCWVYNHDAIDCDLSYLRTDTSYESPQDLIKRKSNECENQYRPSDRMYSTTNPDFKSLLDNPYGKLSERETVRKVIILQEFQDFVPKAGENYTIRYDVDQPTEQTPFWTVHIYKDSTNGDEITLHYYKVDAFTGDISTENSTSSNKSCANITKEEVKNKVFSLPEVKDFSQRMDELKQKYIVDVEEQGKNWNIHIAENHPENLATFNWYTLDKCTGKIKCSFAIYNKEGKFVRDSSESEYPCN